MKKTLIALIVVIIILLGGYFFMRGSSSPVEVSQNDEEIATTTQPQGDGTMEDDTSDTSREDDDVTGLGSSVEGRQILAHHYGDGDTEVLFVGGLHGGYSWNTALVAYELMDHLEENPEVIPENVKVTVIPVANPDGLQETVGTTDRFSKSDVPSSLEARVPGRFNANGVDLNRNFDCEWRSDAVWQDRTVDGGDAPFSEPEAQAIRNYVTSANPDAVVVWYSAAGGVFASNCRGGVLSETTEIMNVYANASGYSAHDDFDFYEITGDMVNWLAKNDIPGISVLISSHEEVEWEKNRKGIEALLNYYAN